jgi:hypothetical protein
MTTLQDIKRVGEFPCNIAALNRMTAQVNRTPWRVYEIMTEYGTFQDSWTRETIFQYIADKYHDGDYEKVYQRWLKGSDVVQAYENGMITKEEFSKMLKS